MAGLIFGILRYFISLLKSKNGSLIKWSTTEVDSFGSHPKPDTLDTLTRNVSLLRIRKEWILPAVTLNLTLLIHDIDQLFDKTSYLYGHFCSPFYPFYRGGKIDLHNPIVLVTTNKTTIHNFAGAYYKTLLFNYISYFNYPKANRPEYNEKSSNLQPCHQQPCCSFSGIPSILWVVSMEMNEK